MSIRTVRVVAAVLLGAVLGQFAAASDDPIVWKGADKAGAWDCRDVDCLVAGMNNTGASQVAIDFARRLTALRRGIPSWAMKTVIPGHKSVIAFLCTQCLGARFVWVNGTGSGMLMVDISGMVAPLLERKLGVYRETHGAHANAVVTDAGEGFLRVHRIANGGTRYEFVHQVADCGTCRPFGAIKYALDFDAAFNEVQPEILGFVSLSSVRHAVWAGGTGIQ